MTITRLPPGPGAAPISRAVGAGSLIYCTTIPDDNAGVVIAGSIREQSLRTFENLRRTLSELGATLADVIHVTVYLTNMNDRTIMSEVWAETFADAPPARATIGVASLAHPDIRIEISAQALRQAA